MKIQYCSDLHLEFPENREFIMKHPLKPVGDILILAGDIAPFCLMNNHSGFFDWLSDNFKTTYWLPGNHEYYHSDIIERSGTLIEKIRDNLLLVNNISLNHGAVKFIFTTLWTKISNTFSFQIRQSLSDFNAIKNGKRGFSPDDYNRLHNQSLDFLKAELKSGESEKKVIITHHVPTMMNYPEKYKGDVLNEAFAVELFGLIEKSDAECWIFGHNHYNTPDFKIGKTLLSTNQLGYIRNNEQSGFNNELYKEIKFIC